MAVNERRLTGRDVLAKTFQAKTKRGYDPVEVDAYLELVAAQIDMLHGDITRAAEGLTPPPSDDAEALHNEIERLSSELAALEVERDTFRDERDGLARANQELLAAVNALEGENDQLRSQVTAVAPPPPGAAPEPAPVSTVPAEIGDERAVEESYELVLRMARRSAEETIAEAHARADEIIADANFTAAQISRESDRKAFEAANKVQAELATLSQEIEARQVELRRLDGQSAERRDALRALASEILVLAEDEGRMLEESPEIVDIRPSDTTV